MRPDQKRGLFHGDGVGGLHALGPDSVDHVMTDPPYSPHVHEKSRGGDARTSGGSKAREFGFDCLTPDLRTRAAIAFARAARRWVLVFSDLEGIGGWIADLEEAGLEHVRVGVWVKLNAAPQFTGDRPGSGAEAIVIAHRPGKKRWNGGGLRAVYSVPVVLDRGGPAAERRVHTAQKPQALMEALVRDFTDAGELVADPFAGSGTTGVACRSQGREFLGWEIDPDHAARAAARIEGTREQLGLFGVRA